jgi:hypothetical protein
MTQDVINLLFPGDSNELLPRYAEGVRRFAETGGVAPEQVVVAHSEQGLRVTLVWGEGIDHELLGRFMLGSLGELGLPMPRVDHASLAAVSWDALAGLALN